MSKQTELIGEPDVRHYSTGTGTLQWPYGPSAAQAPEAGQAGWTVVVPWPHGISYRGGLAGERRGENGGGVIRWCGLAESVGLDQVVYNDVCTG